MRAAYYERQGDPRDVLQVGEMPEPQPGPGEVRVQVRVSAINPSDTKSRQGTFGLGAMRWPRIIPHQDGAGFIDAVGDGVDASRVRQRAWVFEAQLRGPFGTAAEYVVVPSRNAVRLPAAASFDDGASMGVPGMTAHHLLFSDGPIDGQTVLIQGGAGSVGHLAVQLARWAGAHVIATAGSPGQAEVARACGAEHVIDYRADDVVHSVQQIVGRAGVDRIVEVAMAKNFDADATLLRPRGVLSTFMISEDRENPPGLDLQRFIQKDITVHFALVYAMSRRQHDDAVADLTAALDAGALKPRVVRRFALDEIVDAHELVGTAGARGKVLIDVATE
jgi:NADPH:quinone reductase